MDFKPESLATNPVLAAFAGAVVGLRAFPGTNWFEKAGNVLLGFAMAIFAGPALAEWLGVVSPRIGAGVVFGCGAAGLVAFAALIDAIKQTRFAEILASWIPRKGGGQ